MDDRVERLDAAVAELTDQVRTLQMRLVALERARATEAEGQDARPAAPMVSDGGGVPVQQWLALVGRTLVVLGGAYLLRALTDSHVVTAPVGVALGLLYGAPWLLLASRAGARGAQLDALYHALATALIGYPLVWEATLRFGVLAPAESAALLGALTVAALVLSGVTRLHGLAWVVTFGAFGSAAGLALATRDWNSYTLLAIGIGLGTLWLGYIREWGDVRWLAAAGANLMLVFAIDHAALTAAPGGALLLVVVAFAGYGGSFAVRTLLRTRRVGGFEAAQSAAVTAVALGGSFYLLLSSGRAVSIGVAALGLGLIAYVVAFTFARQRRDVRTFFFWALFALVLAVAGTAICAGAVAGSLVYAVSAATLAVIARRRGSLTLDFHASVCAAAASVGSGLVAVTSSALVSTPAAGLKSLDGVALVAFIALAIAVLTPVRPIIRSRARSAAEGRMYGTRIPRLMLVGVFLLTAMGVAVSLATSWFGDPRGVDLSILATLRTAVLVAATLGLARVARYEGGREAGWLMYPLLVATGLKLVFIDWRLGRPQTLFAALALYGVALIVAPRLLRSVSAPGPAEPGQLAGRPSVSELSRSSGPS
jgi:hypothetical protein